MTLTKPKPFETGSGIINAPGILKKMDNIMKSPLRILHLEDDPNDAELVQAILEREGVDCTIVRVEGQEDFVNSLEENEFDLILADYSLPMFDGLTALAIASEICPDVPFILVSGALGEELAIDSMKAGATDYVLKERMVRLVHSVNRALREAEDRVQRRQAEEALKASEAKYQDLYDNAPDMFVSIDVKTGTIIECNRTAADQLGYTKEEMIGRSILDMYTPDSAKRAKENSIPNFIRTGTIEGEELQLQRKDGSKIDVSLNVTAVCDDQGNILQGRSTWRDITEKKKLEAQLQQAQKMESIGTLAGGIAHDFNNILSPIMIHSEMAMVELPPDNPLQFNLKQIYMAGERARDMVKQILTFGRQRRQEKTAIKMGPILKEIIKLLRSTIPTTIEIRHDIKADVDTVFADPTQIHQVILNLCTNASHAMREKGGVLEIGLDDFYFDSEAVGQFPDLNPGAYLRLTVKDTGHGVEPEIMSKIFDPYFTTKGIGEGTGMGLAVAHGIVMSHGGDITVESELGKGTAFQVLFPKFEEDFSGDSESTVQLPKGTGRILFVDDEKAAVDAMQPMLENLGYKVTARTSSIEALEAFRNNPQSFDIVITDQTMPNMTGNELAEELMPIRPDIPIILCTGFSEQIDENKAMNMGIRAFIMKPIIMHEIANTIREVLNKK